MKNENGKQEMKKTEFKDKRYNLKRKKEKWKMLN